MGVRGLTSFIARHAEYYLKPYELHDCNLVIDGDNLACNLYKDVSGKNSAFGGDYDSFYRSVVEFFHVLSECNIRAYVLMDGGYEKKKLRTVWQRMRGKIAGIKKIDPLNSHHIFPLMMREVFVDAVNDCNIPVMRCAFEADEELAALSRKLNCPVLSYDSDFYIYNCKYIPLVTLTMRAHKKRVNQKTEENTKLTKSSAKHLEKRSKAHKIIKTIEVSADDRNAPKTGKTYKYLDCCLYKIEHLVEGGKLSREKLPLFAVLLGNDYIARGTFSAFFAHIKQRGMGKNKSRIQKRVQKILQWLRHETVDSALEKILCSMKKWERRGLLEQVKGAVEGYSGEDCASYKFFKTQYKDVVNEDSEDDESDEGEEEEEEQEKEVDAEPEDVEETEEADENSSQEEQTKNQDPSNDSQLPDEEQDDEDDDDGNETDPNAFLPQWFKDRLYPAKLPRFLVDLAHLRIYINNPQIEHFLFNDCNEIGLPILKHIFCLLYNVRGFEEDMIFAGDPYAGEELPYFRYLTRLTRVTNIHTVRYPLEPSPDIPFYPLEPHPELFRMVFRKLKLDTVKLFKELEKIPPDLQLYFLALVFWIQKTPHADLLHLHALLICLVVLRTVDAKIEPIRDPKAFQKRFGNIIKKEKLIRASEAVRELKPEAQKLSVPERMKFISKMDCLLVQENLLKHFHMQELFKKKYDAFSSTILHGFAEFQSVVFNLNALNGLLGNFHESPKMAQAYCGVFLYNIYELLRSRIDLGYFIQHHIFQSSMMMFDLYEFFWNWCEQFVPEWQRNKTTSLAVSKNVLKKRKAAAKKKAAVASKEVDPNAEMLESETTETADEDDFCDLNNKFSGLLITR